MIEIVFGESACCSLKLAQNCGEEEYNSSVVGMIVSHSDGSVATEEEIQSAKKEIECRRRLEWENRKPIEGEPTDVYGFDYHLSIGDISENVPDQKRHQVLEWVYSVYPGIQGDTAIITEKLQNGMNDLKEVCSRILAKESVRIWYSNQPDELCGMYWFMTQLVELGIENNQIFLVQLPDWEIDEARNMITHSGWNNVKLGDWHRCIGMQMVAEPAFCRECASHWKKLQQENSPLRALLNGRLVSAPETLYDEFIYREMVTLTDEFDEIILIGIILGKYELGINDAWLAHRIESMISKGILKPMSEPAQDRPKYHRKLKKVLV